MDRLYDTKQELERVILVAVDIEDGADIEQSLSELSELVYTAGALPVGWLIQKRDAYHPGTYIGKGKIEELYQLIQREHADTIVCDDELSPAQITNLYDALGVKVLDRTALILDIFAAHAATSEGKLQVELAQLRYRASRLTGLGKSMSRLGGGIGTRGPGEKKLEVDRRLIKDRIAILNRQLKEVMKNRDTQRRKREKNSIPTVAITGYTNAGKSTLLNTLTRAGVLEEDKLFATLDPTTRMLELDNGQNILLTDTVGFINKLPHQLIQAFRSTLEEAKYADLILHVVDGSNPHRDTQMAVVYDTFRELGIHDKKIITVYNKSDRFHPEERIGTDPLSDASVCISAKEATGLDELLTKIDELLNEGMVKIQEVIPYGEAGKLQNIRQYGKLEVEEYREDGIYVVAYVPSFIG